MLWPARTRITIYSLILSYSNGLLSEKSVFTFSIPTKFVGILLKHLQAKIIKTECCLTKLLRK